VNQEDLVEMEPTALWDYQVYKVLKVKSATQVFPDVMGNLVQKVCLVIEVVMDQMVVMELKD